MSEQSQENKELEELVTKGYLKEYLDEKLGANFEATKEYIDLRFDQFGEEMDEKMKKQTATLIQAVDRVLVPADTAEKDRAAHSALHAEIIDDIHDHDKRIKKLELATS